MLLPAGSSGPGSGGVPANVSCAAQCPALTRAVTLSGAGAGGGVLSVQEEFRRAVQVPATTYYARGTDTASPATSLRNIHCLYRLVPSLRAYCPDMIVLSVGVGPNRPALTPALTPASPLLDAANTVVRRSLRPRSRAVCGVCVCFLVSCLVAASCGVALTVVTSCGVQCCVLLCSALAVCLCVLVCDPLSVSVCMSLSGCGLDRRVLDEVTWITLDPWAFFWRKKMEHVI
eukprot:496806-Rhodomonas_salina.3